MNTDTPRTDTETRHCWTHRDGKYIPCGKMVDYRLARQLERELAAATERAEHAEKTAADYAGKACELNINAHLASEELKETKDQFDKLLEALKIIDERVLNRSDCETDLKFCGEVAFAALAAVKGESQ